MSEPNKPNDKPAPLPEIKVDVKDVAPKPEEPKKEDKPNRALEIVKQLDAELKKELGDDVYNLYKDKDVETRVDILRGIKFALPKTQVVLPSKANVGGEPNAPISAKTQIPTLANKNSAKQFRADLLAKDPIQQAVKNIRGKPQ